MGTWIIVKIALVVGGSPSGTLLVLSPTAAVEIVATSLLTPYDVVRSLDMI